MVDPAEIESRYRAMSDEDLMHFALTDGEALTETAFLILKNEFLRRGLSAELLNQIEDGSYKEGRVRVSKIIKTIPDQEHDTALNIALNEKRDGKSDEAIVFHLMETGLDEERARTVLKQVKPEAELLRAKAKTMMLTSTFALCAGFGLYLISPYKPFVTFLDILSTCTIIFSALRLLIGYINFRKYTYVLMKAEAKHTEEKQVNDHIG